MESITKDLNTEQIKALEEINNPVLILAGAGSGKTKVITHKIAYLAKIGYCSPWQVLAVTFTNKAANEMLNRSINLIQSTSNIAKIDRWQLWMGTFHSICARILRREIENIGFSSKFTIYDTEDSASLLKNIITEYKLTDLPKKINTIVQMISSQKSSLRSPGELIKDSNQMSDYTFQQVGKLYDIYQKRLKENDALDFDDLLLRTVQLWKEHPEVLEKYRDKFNYILVDEFQDTNKPQYEMIKYLASGKTSISVVGDDDQSIYSWRGADIKNILNFPKDFNGCVTVKLEQNYRSSNIILKAAHSVVEKNMDRHPKELWSKKGDGENLQLTSLSNDKEEAKYISKVINGIRKKDINTSIAIFYRMNFQSRQIEEALLINNIPYKVFGGTKFYERKEIKDILAYLRLIVNPSDEIALQRIINVPKRGIGKTTMEKIIKVVYQDNLPVLDGINKCIENNIVSGSVISKLKNFISIISELTALNKLNKFRILFESLLEKINYKEYLIANEMNPEDRWNNVEELLNSMITFEKEHPNSTLEDYLNQISLQTDIDEYEETNSFVTLMTLHNSKGLEFDTVFITGLNEGIFPHYRSQSSYKELEEERRLFYVGVTRGRKKVYLTSAANRYTFGFEQYYPKSSFIDELNPDYVDVSNLQYSYDYDDDFVENKSYKKHTSKKEKLAEELEKIKNDRLDEETKYIQELKEIKIGDKVKHYSHGIGIIEKLDKCGTLEAVLVNFNKMSDKKLLILKYAKLELFKE